MKSEAEEIVRRNFGDINDIIGHIDQSIHINTILNKLPSSSILKSINNERAVQLISLKLELQIALAKYKKEEEEKNDKLQ